MRSSKIEFPLFFLTLLLLTSFGCNSLFYYPQKQLYENPTARLFSPEDIYFKTPDGLTLHGWFFRAAEAKGSILVLHGNAENLSTHVNGVLWLVKAGFNVFIFDYRGYGNSKGKPTLDGVHQDAASALETLLSLPGVDQNRVIVLGQSIGGSIAVYLSATTPHKKNIRALIIDSAFASYRLIAREKMNNFWLTWPFQYPLSFLFNDAYNPTKWIGNVSPVPLLIMHGGQDTIVSVQHAQKLFDAALPPKELWLSPGTGHIQAFASDIVRAQLVQYLDRILSARMSK